MRDIINSFKAHLYERTSSPLLGAFIFYWIIFNYKLLIVIFSDLKPIEKFNEITSSVYPTWLEQWGNGLVFPAITTLIYILYFPKISNKIHEKWIKHQNELKEISNGKVLTKKEFGELQQKYFELELSFTKTFSEKDKNITQLKKLLDEKEHLLLESLNKIDEYKNKTESNEKLEQKNLELANILETQTKQITQLQNEVNRTYQNTSEEERKIMESYAKNYKKELTLLDASRLLGLPELKTEYVLNNLKSKNLIKYEFSSPKGLYTYSLQQKGKDYLVENSLI